MITRLVNDAGLTLLKQWEQGPSGGPALTAYRDISGVWTIGYGHTGGVYKGDIITSAQADMLLVQDVGGTADFVAARTDPTQTTDNQFAAMVSLAYNIGNGGFLGSTVLRDHKAQQFSGAAGAFLLWDKAHVDGELVVVRGLLNRRVAEQGLYLMAGS